MDKVIEILYPILVTVVTVVVSMLSKSLYSWLTQKSKESKSTVFQKYLSLASEIVHNVVIQLNQTAVEGIKEASEDGKLTKEEAEKIAKQAEEMVLGQLTGDAKKVLGTAIDDIPAWIKAAIEAYVVFEKESATKNTYEIVSAATDDEWNELIEE